ncbi:hypothetical protein P5V15_001719 [Pogonomyrmex californicus]
MSLEQRKALSLPYSVKSDGKRVYSKCQMYDVNYTQIINSWLEDAYLPNTTDSSSLTTTSSSFLPSTTRLPMPPVSSPDWPVVGCRYGWNYDTKDYDSTLVTEVNSTFSLSPKKTACRSPACSDGCFRHNEALEAFMFCTDCEWAMAVLADCLDDFHVEES